MKEEKIRVLKVAPGEVPCVAVLNNDLESLQEAVSIGCEWRGLIEIVPITDDVAILCHEEGKLLMLEPNRRFGNNDILVGVFYIVGTDDEGNLCSLTEEQMVFYNQVFFFPEKEPITREEIESTLFYEITDFPGDDEE